MSYSRNLGGCCPSYRNMLVPARPSMARWIWSVTVSRGIRGEAPHSSGVPTPLPSALILEKQFQRSNMKPVLRLSTADFTTIGWSPLRVVALAIARAANTTIRTRGRGSQRSEAGARVCAPAVLDVSNSAADPAPSAATRRMAEGASTRSSTARTPRQPAAAPTRSTEYTVAMGNGLRVSARLTAIPEKKKGAAIVIAMMRNTTTAVKDHTMTGASDTSRPSERAVDTENNVAKRVRSCASAAGSGFRRYL